MNKKPILLGLATLAILASIARVYFDWAGRSPRIQLDSYQALGEVAAGETSRLLNQKGRVVVIAPANPSGANPVEAAQLAAFTGAIKKRGGVVLEKTETFSLTPMEQMSAGGNVPGPRLAEMLQAHTQASAFVLFAGFPSLGQPDLDHLKQRGAKIVLVCGWRPSLLSLLEAGVVHMAIVPRQGIPPEGLKPPTTSREWFDRDYVILTRDNARSGI